MKARRSCWHVLLLVRSCLLLPALCALPCSSVLPACISSWDGLLQSSSPSILWLQIVFHSLCCYSFPNTSVKGRLKGFELIQESLKIEVIHHLPHQCGMTPTGPQAALARSCFPILCCLGCRGGAEQCHGPNGGKTQGWR